MRKEVFVCDKCGVAETIMHNLERRPGASGNTPSGWCALAVSIPGEAYTVYGTVHLCPSCEEGFPSPTKPDEYEPTMREYILDILSEEGFEPAP